MFLHKVENAGGKLKARLSVGPLSCAVDVRVCLCARCIITKALSHSLTHLFIHSFIHFIHTRLHSSVTRFCRFYLLIQARLLS